MRLLRVPIVLLLLVGGLLSACSFRGSVTDDGASSTSADRAASTSGGSSAAGSPSAVAAGRSSSGTSTPRTTTRPATSSASGAVDRCHTSELTGSLVPGSPAAGQRYAALVLRDTGGRTCTLRGFGGIGLTDANGHALPTRQVRSGAAPATVVLHPGGTATSQLHWSVVTGSGDAQTGSCQPPATTLRVIPPDETDALSVAWGQGPVCSGGSIDQQAYTG